MSFTVEKNIHPLCSQRKKWLIFKKITKKIKRKREKEK